MQNIKIKNIEEERVFLEKSLNLLVKDLGSIPIASKKLMPYGWRRSAKGRTVWRILEEIISQNLELNAKKYFLDSAIPASGEVGVYDFEFMYNNKKAFVNIKSSVESGRKNKDDISKAPKLIDFFKNTNNNLYVATFILIFNKDMTVSIERAIVFPVSWIPDIYVNPSNNGNLQSSHYKDIDKRIERTSAQFLLELIKQNDIAFAKKIKNTNH